MLHRRTFAPVKAVDPDAIIEDLVSGELFDLDLEEGVQEGADWASD
jgi:ribonuclease HII